MTRTHRLKTWPEFFKAIDDGRKTFEVRADDRGFMEGDLLVLQEYDPSSNEIIDREKYTGREIRRHVTYKLPGGKFGIDPSFCVLGLSRN